jgi:hypothetical protein
MGARLRQLFPVRRDDDGGNAVAGRHEHLIQLEPRHTRHFHVGDQAGRPRATRRAQETLCVFERSGGEAGRLQQILCRIPDGLVVVHDRDEWAFTHFASRN